MKIPSIEIADKLLDEAERFNFGKWANHSRVAGECAKVIASHCDDLDEDNAYVLGLPTISVAEMA